MAVSFEVCEDGEIPVGYKKITCHWTFDVKLVLNLVDIRGDSHGQS